MRSTAGTSSPVAFGYYLNPLANILLGRFILKERLTKLQWAAVAIAAAGIAVLAAGALGTLWISLTLCSASRLTVFSGRSSTLNRWPG
jgi:chloramphenicol-sensitive protein RarD